MSSDLIGVANILATVKKEKYRILNAIMRGVWFIEPITALNSYPLVKAFMDGGDAEQEEKEPEPKLIAYSLDSGNLKPVMGFSFDDAPQGSIAIIPVNGSLMKEDYCGIPGMRSLGQLVQDADTHPNIIGSVMVHDSPGGTADGTEEFAMKVKNTTKPVVAFVDGMSGSASYWVASQANHIILSGKTSGVGSIGTMISMADVQPMWEKEGVKFHTVVSDQSPDKNKDFYDMLKGEYGLIKKNLLNPHAQAFIDSVKESRGDLPEEATKGGFFIGEKGITLGLADSIGTLEDAIKKVEELSKAPASTQLSNKSQNSDMFSSKLDKAVKHLAEKVKADGGYENVTLEDHIDPVNHELANLGLDSLVVASKKGISDIEAERDAALQAQKKAETERDEAKAEAAKLSKKPGATHTDPAAKKDNDGGDAKTDPEVVNESEEFGSYEHNLAALKEIENL